MAVFVAAPRAWNWLPTELTLLWSTTTFCCYLNTFLFFFCSSLFMDTGTDDCFVMCPWSPRRRSNINNPVTVPVNKLMCVCGCQWWGYWARFLQVRAHCSPRRQECQQLTRSFSVSTAAGHMSFSSSWKMLRMTATGDWCDRKLWPMTLVLEPDVDRITLN